MTEVKVPKKLKESIGSYGLSSEMLGMFKSGKTVKEIAEHYKLAWSSVKERLQVLANETGEKLTLPDSEDLE